MASFPLQQPAFAVAKQHEVVDIAQIFAAAQLSQHKPVKIVHVYVRPELRSEIADGQAARAARGEQVVTSKVDLRVLAGEHAWAYRE